MSLTCKLLAALRSTLSPGHFCFQSREALGRETKAKAPEGKHPSASSRRSPRDPTEFQTLTSLPATATSGHLPRPVNEHGRTPNRPVLLCERLLEASLELNSHLFNISTSRKSSRGACAFPRPPPPSHPKQKRKQIKHQKLVPPQSTPKPGVPPQEKSGRGGRRKT